MMISYEGLLQKLNDKGLTKTALTEELGISSRTVAKIGRGETSAFQNCCISGLQAGRTIQKHYGKHLVANTAG